MIGYLFAVLSMLRIGTLGLLSKLYDRKGCSPLAATVIFFGGATAILAERQTGTLVVVDCLTSNEKCSLASRLNAAKGRASRTHRVHSDVETGRDASYVSLPGTSPYEAQVLA